MYSYSSDPGNSRLPFRVPDRAPKTHTLLKKTSNIATELTFAEIFQL